MADANPFYLSEEPHRSDIHDGEEVHAYREADGAQALELGDERLLGGVGCRGARAREKEGGMALLHTGGDNVLADFPTSAHHENPALPHPELTPQSSNTLLANLCA